MMFRFAPTKSLVLLFFLLVLPFFLPNQYYIHILVLSGVYVILALGLNVVVGFAGLLDLGYVAFYAVGAYSHAILSTVFHCSFWINMLIGASLATILGVLIGVPTLRTRGDYLALVTLGFGEMIRLLLRNWDSLTNGPKGISGIQPPSLFGFVFTQPIHFYYLIIFFSLFTFLVVRKLQTSAVGRYWFAIKDNETAASAMGLDPTKWKLYAFAVGAFFAGIAGVFFAAWQSFVAPESFTLWESIIILAMVVMGGMGNLTGCVIAAMVLVLLPEFLRGFEEFRMLIFGIAMVSIVVVQQSKFGAGITLLKPLVSRIYGYPNSSKMGPKKVPLQVYRPVSDTFGRNPDSDQGKPIFKVENLSKTYRAEMNVRTRFQRNRPQNRLSTKKEKGVTALKEISIEIYKGEICGLIGPNGAGKTTLINCITGMTPYDSGVISVNNTVLSNKDKFFSYEISRMGIARTFQKIKLFPSISVLDNILFSIQAQRKNPFFSSLFPFKKYSQIETEERGFAEYLLSLIGLKEFSQEYPLEMPLGYQKLVEVARALATLPHLLILDEPASGLSTGEKEELESLLKRLKKEGLCYTKDFSLPPISILLIEHDMQMVRNISDRIIVLNEGERVKLDNKPPQAVLSDPLVLEIYLGKAKRTFTGKNFNVGD